MAKVTYQPDIVIRRLVRQQHHKNKDLIVPINILEEEKDKKKFEKMG